MIDINSMKDKILEFAIIGKLSEQRIEDGNAEELYNKLTSERKRLANNKIIKNKEFELILEDKGLFEIPNNWKWIRLGEISSIISKGTTPRGGNVAYTDSAIGFLRAENLVGYDRIDCSNMKYVDEDTHLGFLKRSILEDGDVLISIAGTLGRTGLVRSDNLTLNTNQAIAFIRFVCKEAINVEYVSYILNAPTIQKELGNKKVDMAIPNLSLDVIANSLIPLPPLAEQKRIVEKIRKSFECLDKIEELQTQYASDIDVLKSKLIDAGIQGKLTEQLLEDGVTEELFAEIQKEKAKLIKEKKIKKEKALVEISDEEIPFEIPDNWKWVRLGDVCSKISSGNTPTGGSKGGAYVTEGFCFFREQNVYNDGIHYDGMVYITEELLKTRVNSTVLPQDILLNITGGSIGRCALIPDDFSKGSINQHILIIRVVDPRIRQYVHICLCSPYYQKLIRGNVVGDKDGFSAGRCKNTLIPLPPISEQERIVGKLDELLSLI